MLSAVKAMSNDRCISHYFPLIAYIAPLQMAEVGDITPFSTRAIEGKGGRYKRISKRCCHRKKAAVVWKAVRNLKKGTTSFKKQSYNSSRSLQMARTALMQEESAHGSHGRSRLATTGRKTLTRSLPKLNESPLPARGNLLNAAALAEMVEKAAEFFNSPGAGGFATEACLEAEDAGEA